MSENIVEKLKARDRLHVALVAVLGRDVHEDRTTAIPCPEHQAHGCKTPAAVVAPTYGRVSCKGCGKEWGLLELGVQMDYAESEPLVALKLQEEFLGLEMRGAPKAPALTPERCKAKALEAMAALQDADPKAWRRCAELWGLDPDALIEACGGADFDAEGKPRSFLIPAYDAEGDVVGLKERRDPNHPPRSKTHGRAGILNAHRVSDLDRDGWVVVCEGESDMLALQAKIDEELLPMVAVSPSTGAGQDLAPLAPLFANRNVAVVYDEDDAGRAGAEKAAAQLAAAAQEVRRVRLPFGPEQIEAGNKDLRDWLAIHRRGKPRTAQHLLDEIEEAKAEAPPEHYDWDRIFVPLEALLAEPDHPEDWLVKDWLERECTATIFGASFSGKSLAAWSFGLCLARGYGTVLSRAIECDPKRVVLFYGENTRKQVRDAYRKQLAGDGVPAGLVTADMLSMPPGEFPDLSTEKGREWYMRAIEARPFDVGIIDNFMSLVVKDRTKSETATEVMRFLSQMSKAHGITWITVSHTRKAGSKGDLGSSQDKIYGAQEWYSFSDTATFMQRVPGDPQGSTRRFVHHEKVRGMPEGRPFIVDLNEETLHYEFVAELGQAPQGGRPASVTAFDIRELLRKNAGTPLGRKRIAEELECGRDALKRRVQSEEFREWLDAGFIQETKVSREVAYVWPEGTAE